MSEGREGFPPQAESFVAQKAQAQEQKHDVPIGRFVDSIVAIDPRDLAKKKNLTEEIAALSQEDQSAIASNLLEKMGLALFIKDGFRYFSTADARIIETHLSQDEQAIFKKANPGWLISHFQNFSPQFFHHFFTQPEQKSSSAALIEVLKHIDHFAPESQEDVLLSSLSNIQSSSNSHVKALEQAIKKAESNLDPSFIQNLPSEISQKIQELRQAQQQKEQIESPKTENPVSKPAEKLRKKEEQTYQLPESILSQFKDIPEDQEKIDSMLVNAFKEVNPSQIKELIYYITDKGLAQSFISIAALAKAKKESRVQLPKGKKFIVPFDRYDLDIANKFIECNESKLLWNNLPQFSGLDQKVADVMLGVAKESLQIRKPSKVKTIESVDDQALVIFSSNLESFRDLDTNLALRLFSLTGVHYDQIKAFKDQMAIAQYLYARDKKKLVFAIPYLKDLNSDIARLLLPSYSRDIIKNIDSFTNLDTDVKIQLIESLIPEYAQFPEFDEAYALNKRFGSVHGVLNAYSKIYAGEPIKHGMHSHGYQPGELSPKRYKKVKALLYEEAISDDFVALGVKHPGEAGIIEVQRAIRSARSEFLQAGTPDEYFERVLKSEILFEDLLVTSRFAKAQWGNQDPSYLKKIITHGLRSKEHKQPMHEAYEPSPVLQIKTIERDTSLKYEYASDFLSRYSTLFSSVQLAKERASSEGEGGLDSLTLLFEQKRAEVIAQLEKNLALQSQNIRAQTNIQDQINRLSALNFQELENPQNIVTTLMGFRGQFDELLRQTVFYSSFMINDQFQKDDLSQFSKDAPTLDQVSWMLNFIDHITNKETFRQFFSEKSAIAEFQKLLGTKSLQDTLTSLQHQGKVGVTTMRFIPGRDIKTELSGYFADACWADKYKSILEQFPNITSLTMVQNPDNEKNQRIAGACLLIEGESKKGKPLLIIRGLNPIENVANQLNLESFFTQLVSYLKPIAAKMNRELCIVINKKAKTAGTDDTNRPLLFQYLHEKVLPNLKNVRLRQDDKTTFNGYDIENNVYAIS